MYKQIKFKCYEDGDEVYGGIGLYEEQSDGVEDLKLVICGCCGSVFDPNEIEVIEKYNNWINLSDEIIGE